MSTMSVRLPESLHERAREIAKREGVSINQLVATALAEKLSALDTLDTLESRGSGRAGIAGGSSGGVVPRAGRYADAWRRTRGEEVRIDDHLGAAVQQGIAAVRGGWSVGSGSASGLSADGCGSRIPRR